MPIYEFFCDRCRTVFNFYSRRVNPGARPDCPRCAQPRLERWMSRFATPSGRSEDAELPDDGEPDMDPRMERALEGLAGEAESLSEDDPRQAATLMRRFSEVSGMPLSGSMREALERLEKGDDPEAIEAEMGDALENDDPFDAGDEGLGDDPGGNRRRKAASRPVRHDETLYDLDAPPS